MLKLLISAILIFAFVGCLDVEGVDKQKINFSYIKAEAVDNAEIKDLGLFLEPNYEDENLNPELDTLISFSIVIYLESNKNSASIFGKEPASSDLEVDIKDATGKVISEEYGTYIRTRGKENDVYKYGLIIKTKDLYNSGFLSNVSSINFKYDQEATMGGSGYHYTSNKITIPKEDIEKILIDRGIVFQ